MPWWLIVNHDPSMQCYGERAVMTQYKQETSEYKDYFTSIFSLVGLLQMYDFHL